jgi:hypothetical protein
MPMKKFDAKRDETCASAKFGGYEASNNGCFI